MSEAKPGKLPALAAGLALTKAEAADQAGTTATAAPAPRGLILTAFGHNPYGEETLLRLWEQIGEPGAYTAQLPNGMKAHTAQPCNLRGEITGPPLAVSESGAFNMMAKPMAPTSVILLGDQR